MLRNTGRIMSPAWLGPTKCKQSVIGEPMSQCPIKPSKIRWVEGHGFTVTKNKCRLCGSEFEAAFKPVQISAKAG